MSVINPPDAEQHAALVRSLASPRLRAYRATFGGDDQAAIDLYLFEMQISGGLNQLLGLVEVAMREAMHRELATAYGSRWYDLIWSKLDDRTRAQITKAKSKLPRNPPVGKVVAEMDFGTWTCLLEPGGFADARTRQAYKTDYEADLWEPALKKAFIGSGIQPARADVAQLTRHLRYARNRIAHRESIMFGIPQPGQRNSAGKWLRQTPTSLLIELRQTMHHIDSDLGSWMDSCDGVDDLLADTRALKALAYAKTATNKAFI